MHRNRPTWDLRTLWASARSLPPDADAARSPSGAVEDAAVERPDPAAGAAVPVGGERERQDWRRPMGAMVRLWRGGAAEDSAWMATRPAMLDV
jgi:hypothetical protein